MVYGGVVRLGVGVEIFIQNVKLARKDKLAIFNMASQVRRDEINGMP